MEQINYLSKITEFFSKIMGTDTEIVIHDLVLGEVVWIRNGQITGRNTGTKDDPTAMKVLAEQASHSSTPDMLVGYKSATKKSQKLRASSLFLPDENGNYRYAICVNQDISGLEAIQRYLSVMTSSTMDDTKISAVDHTEESIESLTYNLILAEIEREKPFSLDSKETKISILRRLDEKGIFEVRRAVPTVCEILQIAQATLYKYLREIHNESSKNV